MKQAINLRQAKKICDASEYELVRSSTPRNIKQLSVAELKDCYRLARRARKKWSDLTQQQTRNRQQRNVARQVEAPARSQEKATLLAQAMENFADRLAQVESGKVKTPPDSRPERKPKAQRAAGHRAERAAVRDALDGETQRLRRKKRAARSDTSNQPAAVAPAKKKSAVKKKSAHKKTASKAAKGQGATKTVGAAGASATSRALRATLKKKQVKRAARRLSSDDLKGQPTGRARPSQLGAANARELPSSAHLRKQNLSAKKAALAARMAKSERPRVLAHLSAQNKRSQARRDAK